MSEDSHIPRALALLETTPAIEILKRNLPADIVENLEITPEQLKLIEAHINNEGSLGLRNRLPIVCKAQDCRYSEICVFHKTGLAPVGHGCPEEKIIIDKLVPALVKELQVDPENAVELDMIGEYVDAELQEIRAQKELAVKGQTQEVVVAIDPATGKTYTETKESSSLATKERAQRRKERFRKDFMATREQRAKYKLNGEKDPSTAQAEKLKKYEEIQKRHRERFEAAEVVQDATEDTAE